MRGRWAAVDVAATCLIVTAVLIRFTGLGQRSLWIDEAVVANTALGPLAGLPTGHTPVLFSWLVRATVGVLGRSEMAVRLPAALFGIAATALTWRVSRRMLAPAGGLLATAVVGLFPIPVYFSRELKPYSAELCLGLVIIAATATLRANRRSSIGWGTLFLAVAVGSGLSPVTPILAAGAFIALLPGIRRNPGMYVVTAGTCVLASVIWLFAVFSGQLAAHPELVDYWHLYYLPHGPGLLTNAIRSFAEAATWALGTDVPHLNERLIRVPTLGSVPLLATMAALTFGAVSLILRRDGWLVGLALTWHVLLAAASWAGRYPYGPSRLALVFLGPTALALGAATDAAARLLPFRLRPLVWATAALALTGPIAATWRDVVAHPYEHEELRPVLDAVRARANPTDTIWVASGAHHAFRFYVPEPDARTVLGPNADDPTAMATSLGDALARGGGRMWVILAHRAPVEELWIRRATGGRAVISEQIRATGAAGLLLTTPPEH